MPENPKEMLPENRRSTCLSLEELRSEVTLQSQHNLRCRQWGEKHHDQKHRDESQPDEQRHPMERHSLGPVADDCHHDVDPTRYTADTAHEDAERPVVDAGTLGKGRRSQGSNCKPPGVGSRAGSIQARAGDKTKKQQKSAEK